MNCPDCQKPIEKKRSGVFFCEHSYGKYQVFYAHDNEGENCWTNVWYDKSRLVQILYWRQFSEEHIDKLMLLQ